MTPKELFEEKEHQERLKKINEYWTKFYDKVEAWMKPDLSKLSDIILKDHKAYIVQYNLLKNAVIKKHVSSTHTWIKGKSHYLKGPDNWYESSLECAVCKMHATKYEEVGYDSVEVLDIPSRDSHNQVINRTCAEVLAAREAYRKVRKGTKCHQCWTYGCLMKEW